MTDAHSHISGKGTTTLTYKGMHAHRERHMHNLWECNHSAGNEGMGVYYTGSLWPLRKLTFLQSSVFHSIKSAVISATPSHCVSQQKLAGNCEIRYCTACIFALVFLCMHTASVFACVRALPLCMEYQCHLSVTMCSYFHPARQGNLAWCIAFM